VAPQAAAQRNAEESVAAVAAAEGEDLEMPPGIPTSPPPAQQKKEEETCVWLLQRCTYVCKMTPQVCVHRLISRLISQMLTAGAFRQQPLRPHALFPTCVCSIACRSTVAETAELAYPKECFYQFLYQIFFINLCIKSGGQHLCQRAALHSRFS
jgi:hypothetical protein